MFVFRRGRAKAGRLIMDSVRSIRALSAPLALLGVGLMAVAVIADTFASYGAAAEDPNTVTRADVPMIVLPQPVPRISSEPVSQLITRPVRITDKSARSHDLNVLVTDALLALGYQSSAEDPLHRLLVQTLAERQSDAYIDATLNVAFARAAIAPPAVLIRAPGKLDTSLLLNAVLAQAGG